jgi:dolichol-phosphate mannosyltransferase
MVGWIGFEQAGIPYSSRPRAAGKSKYTVGRLLRLATDVVAGFSNRPLRLALNLGFLVSCASIAFGISAFVSKLLGVFVVPGWTSVIVLVGVVGGVQLIVVGIVGEYVGQMDSEVKCRPPCFRATHGFEEQPPGIGF